MEAQKLVDEYNQTKSLASQARLLAMGGYDKPIIARILGVSFSEVVKLLSGKEVDVNPAKEAAVLEALQNNVKYSDIQKNLKASGQNITEVRKKYNIPARKSGRKSDDGKPTPAPKAAPTSKAAPAVSDNEDKNRAYYKVFNIETIGIIKVCLTKQEYIGFLKGNLVKYALRAGFKTQDPSGDLEKRNEYQKWLLQEMAQ